MSIYNIKNLFKEYLLKTVPFTGLHKLYYTQKKIKTYFLHRVVSADHPYYDYHVKLAHLTVSGFEERLTYIMKYNRIISLQEYCDIVTGNKPVNENMVLLTLDDGYRCLYANVFPLLKKYSVPAVVFVTGNCIELQIVPFHDRLLYTLIKSIGKQLCISLGDFSYKAALSDKDTVCSAYSTMSKYLKSVPDEVKNSFIHLLMDNLSISEESVLLDDEMLTWEQLKEMHSSGLVAIGAHTMNHPILSKLVFEAMKKEIIDSKEIIEKRLCIPVSSFAYPNGRLIDVNTQTLDIIRSNFKLAFCTLGRPWQDDRFLITRHGFDITPGYLLPLIDSGLIDPFASYRLTSYDRIAYLNDPHRLAIPERMYS